jgi:hypothetical protein
MVKVTGEIAKAKLGDVKWEERFYCQDGKYLKNLKELEAALREMSDKTFRAHASGDKNDFSNWVRDVFSDDKLARDLLKSTSQTQAAKAVAERLAWLKSKL